MWQFTHTHRRGRRRKRKREERDGGGREEGEEEGEHREEREIWVCGVFSLISNYQNDCSFIINHQSTV